MLSNILIEAQNDIKNGYPEIAAERLIDALDKSPNLIDARYHDDTRNLLVFTLSRYRILGKSNGVLSTSDFSMELNQIIFSLLEQIKSIKKVSADKIVKESITESVNHSDINNKKGSIEITIDENLESYSNSQLISFLQFISKVSEDKSVVIKNITKGSVKITIEASEEDIKILYHLIKLGLLKALKVVDADIIPDNKVDSKKLPTESAKLLEELQEIRIIELNQKERINIKNKYKKSINKRDDFLTDERLNTYFQLQDEIAKNKKTESINGLSVLFMALSPLMTVAGLILIGKVLFNLFSIWQSAINDDEEEDTFRKIEAFLQEIIAKGTEKKIDVVEINRLLNQLHINN